MTRLRKRDTSNLTLVIATTKVRCTKEKQLIKYVVVKIMLNKID